MWRSREYIGITVLIILHTVGAVSVAMGMTHVLMLTPLNLLMVLAVILIGHNDWRRWWIFLATYFLGFSVEAVGVNTGWPFGDYEYDAVLGWKIFETPLMIGVNWLILIYAANAIANRAPFSGLNRSIIAAALMVLLDLFIEPIAIAYGFWTWASDIPPFSNYMAWFVVAFLLSLIWQYSGIKQNLRIGFAVYLIQLAFFGTLNLLL